MIFYAFLGIMTLALVTWFMRSATFKQLRRGSGTDASQWGTPLDHLQEQGSAPGWNDDGAGGGRRASRRESKHTKPRH
jgi:hypothetical protein